MLYLLGTFWFFVWTLFYAFLFYSMKSPRWFLFLDEIFPRVIPPNLEFSETWTSCDFEKQKFTREHTCTVQYQFVAHTTLCASTRMQALRCWRCFGSSGWSCGCESRPVGVGRFVDFSIGENVISTSYGYIQLYKSPTTIQACCPEETYNSIV